MTPGFLLPSAAYCITRKQAHRYQWLDKKPGPCDPTKPHEKMILVVGTTMNSGKSLTAA